MTALDKQTLVETAQSAARCSKVIRVNDVFVSEDCRMEPSVLLRAARELEAVYARRAAQAARADQSIWQHCQQAHHALARARHRWHKAGQAHLALILPGLRAAWLA